MSHESNNRAATLAKIEKLLREIEPHDAPSQARKAVILGLLPDLA
jgi:hypothetical protein